MAAYLSAPPGAPAGCSWHLRYSQQRQRRTKTALPAWQRETASTAAKRQAMDMRSRRSLQACAHQLSRLRARIAASVAQVWHWLRAPFRAAALDAEAMLVPGSTLLWAASLSPAAQLQAQKAEVEQQLQRAREERRIVQREAEDAVRY